MKEIVMTMVFVPSVTNSPTISNTARKTAGANAHGRYVEINHNLMVNTMATIAPRTTRTQP